MNVLIVYAHPEPRSLNGSLKNLAFATLERAGHSVQVSDLYGMGWKPQIDAADFPDRDPTARLDLIQASQHAFDSGTQSEDVEAEQRKLLWADAVILQFPMWWFSMPAILKGWVERVYAYGFAYGVGEHSETRYGDRFGEGPFKGKRAMLLVTAGGWEAHYSERGINGPMQDLLFPINRGILHYPGFEVLDPFVIYQSGKVDGERYKDISKELEARLATLFTDAPIPYRMQNGGDYTMPSLQLQPGLAELSETGFRIHVAKEGVEQSAAA